MSRGLSFVETRNHEFVVEECCSCGVAFAMTRRFYDECRRRPIEQKFYCPNGHQQWYTGKSDRERIAQLEADKIALNSRLATVRSEAEAAARARDRAKAEKKRILDRVANGICPYCNRSFQSSRLQRHIHSKHPDKAHGEDTK
jgi:hypothetical protein